jgi:copper transport protein
VRAALALSLLVVALVASGGAFAHAQLVTADPPAGGLVAAAPEAVTLTFSEPVRPLAARWFPPDGAPVEATPRAEGARVVVPVPAGTGTGTLLLSWRVVSADGHPVTGSHAFSVGRPTAVAEAPAAAPAWGAAAGRGMLTLSLVLGVGGAVFLRVIHRGPAPPRRARRLALWSACAGVPAAVAATGLHGLDLLGAPAGALLGRSPWAAAVASPFAATAAVGALAAIAAAVALRREGPTGAPLACLAWGLAAGSFALFGHAATAPPRWLTGPAVAVHAAAFIYWLGALPGLAECAARHDLAPSLRRFSALALPLVGLLVLSGAILTVVQVPRAAALIETPYGRLLTAKLAAVGLLLALAALNRLSLTPAIERGSRRATTRFRGSVRAEILLGLVILALASGFRLAPPPRAMAEAAPAPLHLHLHGSTLTGSITLIPGRAGPNSVELVLPTVDPLEVRIAFADPAGGVEPIRLEAAREAAIWRAGPVFLPHGGAWEVTLDVLVSDFARETLNATVTVPDR